MKLLFAIALTAALGCAATLRAGEKTVVVELFTSQGCSSCPPADALMEKLIRKDHVIALSLHVDYWDYIGWKDRFASPDYTKRQKAYAHVSGRNMVYTPQMIVNGTDQVVGARAMELADLIVAHATEDRLAEVMVERDGNLLKIGLLPLGEGLDGTYLLQLVRYTKSRTIDITKGENAGRTMTYLHVVDGWETIGEWDGKTPLTVEAEIDGDRPAVILVQEHGPGPIVAAAALD
ncbi:DUF1223 domain-containing protein [Marinibacterium profundimaris]|uniref:Uncharacterized protein n=1 Tax=Marinibacterium profundimaris TaxID=1679460 RepID=A0A225NYM1_9RHOB|nr:DUF1223 domain-containing protein [Marinibacterium profundimaris]OWU77256.1 hypothetical protein ATO3_00495 [Marinibacterium profundimaris]